MFSRGFFVALVVVGQIYGAKAHASSEALAARLEKVANQRLGDDEFRQLSAIFENGLRQQVHGGLLVRVNTSDSERTYLACVAGNISAGVSFAGMGVCSDMNGNLYSLDFGFTGLGLGAGANVFGGYIETNGYRVSRKDIGQGDRIHFGARAGGATVGYGARVICGSSRAGFDLCLYGLEFGLGASITPDGYLTFSSLALFPKQ